MPATLSLQYWFVGFHTFHLMVAVSHVSAIPIVLSPQHLFCLHYILFWLALFSSPFPFLHLLFMFLGKGDIGVSHNTFQIVSDFEPAKSKVLVLKVVL